MPIWFQFTRTGLCRVCYSTLLNQRGIVVYGLQAGDVTLRDAFGIGVLERLADRINAEGNVAVYILAVEEKFDLEVVSDHNFEVGGL